MLCVVCVEFYLFFSLFYSLFFLLSHTHTLSLFLSFCLFLSLSLFLQLINTLRAKINLVEQIEHVGGKESGKEWIHEYKGMKDKNALLSAITRIYYAGKLFLKLLVLDYHKIYL